METPRANRIATVAGFRQVNTITENGTSTAEPIPADNPIREVEAQSIDQVNETDTTAAPELANNVSHDEADWLIPKRNLKRSSGLYP